ncbi:MAG: hypothetical protein PUF50_06960, partial [Erysipelotrichaceae bacterium]|nr:hypothetical protein [Erysipelotrichaceae bacterium]
MFKRLFISMIALALMLSTFVSNAGIVFAQEKQSLAISVVCEETNDLYNTLINNYEGVIRYDTFQDAYNAIGTNGTKGIMILADAYPTLTTVNITEEQRDALVEKGVRLYIEYPENNSVLGIDYGTPQAMGYDRAIVVNAEAMQMENMSLLYVHGAHYVTKAYTSDDESAWLVNARVAGYDTAVFGLTDCKPYVMIDVNDNV